MLQLFVLIVSDVVELNLENFESIGFNIFEDGIIFYDNRKKFVNPPVNNRTASFAKGLEFWVIRSKEGYEKCFKDLMDKCTCELRGRTRDSTYLQSYDPENFKIEKGTLDEGFNFETNEFPDIVVNLKTDGGSLIRIYGEVWMYSGSPDDRKILIGGISLHESPKKDQYFVYPKCQKLIELFRTISKKTEKLEILDNLEKLDISK